MIRFQHPLWLFALILPALAVWLSLRRGFGKRPSVPAAALRAALLTALVLALAGLHLRLEPRDFTLVVLLDRSMSVPEDEQARAWRWIKGALERSPEGERVAVVSFGSDAALEAEPQPRLRLGAPQAVVEREATDVAGALRLARSLLPPEGGGRIVLLSDGLETDGDMLGEAARLSEAGLPVDVVPLAGAAPADMIVERLEAPSEISAHETFELRATLWTSTAMTARARLFRGEELAATRMLTLASGRSTVAFQDRLAAPGLTRYSLYLDSVSDTRPQNNQASAAVEVRGPPAALIIESVPGHASGLARSLTDAGIRVREVGMAGFPRGLAEMAPYSAIFLDNVPAYALSPRSQAELRSYVGDLGGGLAMLGGDRSFAAGGWQNTPVEEALPVDMESKRPDKEVSLAIVVVIDRSGSMSMSAPSGVQKIQLAAEGAIRLVEMLRPEQTVGVCAVDTQPDWIVPLGAASSRAEMIERIGRLRAGGGGILVYTGLEAAWEALRPSKAAVRHVILFSDSADTEEQEKNGRSAVELIAQMNAAGVTVSSIGLGNPEDKDTAFLEQAARVGKGRFYHTSDSESLPSIFIREGVLARKAAFVQEPFLPKVKRRVDLLKGIDWASAPELRGYVVADAKEAADVGLVSHKGDPILATWRYGLGRSMAFTSDVQGAWSERWSRWSGAGKLWTQSTRWIAKPSAPENLSLRAELSGREARLIVDASEPDGAALNFLKLEGQVVGPDLKKEGVRFEQTGVGRYEAVVRASAEGSYLVRLQATGGQSPMTRVSSFIVPYPSEFQRHEADSARLARLAELTRGRWSPAQNKLFLREPGRARRPVDLSRLLLALAALLLPLDVAARRLRWRAEVLQPAAAAASSRWARLQEKLFSVITRRPVSAATVPVPAKPQTSWDRLKDAKRRARRG